MRFWCILLCQHVHLRAPFFPYSCAFMQTGTDQETSFSLELTYFAEKEIKNRPVCIKA